MSKQKSEVTSSDRRQFIKTMGVAGGAVVAAAVAGEVSAEVVEEESTAKAKGSQGYRETDHVRAYYASARI
ncbi:MAG: twin-arginine translocation signal domain-containing protein [Halopseudomonas sp.]